MNKQGYSKWNLNMRRAWVCAWLMPASCPMWTSLTHKGHVWGPGLYHRASDHTPELLEGAYYRQTARILKFLHQREPDFELHFPMQFFFKVPSYVSSSSDNIKFGHLCYTGSVIFFVL